MHKLHAPHGVTISYETRGSGPPLVLVHGGFSDHSTNWEFVAPSLAEHFTLYAIARRGRGETDTSEGHTLEEESRDTVALIASIDQPVYLLGHSYGAHVALNAGAESPGRVRKLIVYEPPSPQTIRPDMLDALASHAHAGDWDTFSFRFFNEVLFVPRSDLEALRSTELWAPIVADAPASLGDLRAVSRYIFQPDRFSSLPMPVLLQIGSESPRHLYVTDALAAVLADARIESLQGQAHEGMTTAPDAYVRSVLGFFLNGQQMTTTSGR